MHCKALWAILLAFCLSGCSTAFAEPDYQALADAIKRVEGSPSYGIKSVHFNNVKEAREICIRTCRHAWRRYLSANGLKSTKNGYLVSLADRYCPAQTDLLGNRRWKINIVRIYKEGI